MKAIHISLQLADRKECEVGKHRLEAGTMLVALRKRVEAEGRDWWQFANDHFDRSRKDIEKLMRIASADDPEAAAAKERDDAKARMAKSRRVGANVRSKVLPSDELGADAMQLVERMTEEQCAEFISKLKRKANCGPRGRDQRNRWMDCPTSSRSAHSTSR